MLDSELRLLFFSSFYDNLVELSPRKSELPASCLWKNCITVQLVFLGQKIFFQLFTVSFNYPSYVPSLTSIFVVLHSDHSKMLERLKISETTKGS